MIFASSGASMGGEAEHGVNPRQTQHGHERTGAARRFPRAKKSSPL